MPGTQRGSEWVRNKNTDFVARQSGRDRAQAVPKTLQQAAQKYVVENPTPAPAPPPNAPSYNTGAAPAVNPMAGIFEQQKKDSIMDVSVVRDFNKTAYDEAVKKLTEHYATAEQDRGSSYVDARNNIGKNLQNLGINFADTDLAKEWDADQRILTETADTALATDMAWFEKIKTLDTSLYNAMIAELSKAQMMPGGGSGGGGGGRRSGGGGGSSDSGDTAVTEDGIMYNPLLAAALQGMDPMYQLAYDAAGHNPTTASANAAKARLEAMAKPITPVSRFRGLRANPITSVQNILRTATSVPKNVVQTASRNQTVRKNTALSDFFNQFSPGRSPQIQKVTTKTKGKS